jgi:hypothetical protein
MPFDHNLLALFEKVKQPGQMRLASCTLKVINSSFVLFF